MSTNGETAWGHRIFESSARGTPVVTFDREDNDGNYVFSNCRFIENSINCVKDKKKTILQYNLNGNFIREWKSAVEASKNLDISESTIRNSCRGLCKGKGYIWKHKENKQ